MSEIEFKNFSDVDPEELLPILNDPSLRTHLVDHPIFDNTSIRAWIDEKSATNSLPGCRVSVVCIDKMLAGWCGIQPDENGFEIAIVLSKSFWGAGITIFNSLMRWAKELGHHEILFHLLETRPEYNFLKRKATKVKRSTLLNRNFTTYFISVCDWQNKQLSS